MFTFEQNIGNGQLENVEVRVLDAKKNRGLISKKNFTKDEVIFMEKPLVCSQFAWNKFYNYKACENCMKPLETAEENVRRLTENKIKTLPHMPECCGTNKSTHRSCTNCGVEYCSDECRQHAYHSYHQSLCLGTERDNSNHPYNILLDAWRQTHLPPETTTIELILKLVGTIKQTANKTEFINKILNFEYELVNEKEQIPHKLLNEKYFNDLEGLRFLTLEYFNNFLHVKECEPWLSQQGFRQLFSLIGRNSQGVGTSSFSVWVENCSKLNLNKPDKKNLDKLIDKIYDKLDKVSGTFLNSEGSGLYEMQSMINHNCQPNAEIKFSSNNNILTIVALDEIKPNQEILISYLDECQLGRSRHSRQKILRENYLFTCECERCASESNQPDVTSEEDNDEDFDEENDSDDDGEQMDS